MRVAPILRQAQQRAVAQTATQQSRSAATMSLPTMSTSSASHSMPNVPSLSAARQCASGHKDRTGALFGVGVAGFFALTMGMPLHMPYSKIISRIGEQDELRDNEMTRKEWYWEKQRTANQKRNLRELGRAPTRREYSRD